MSVLFVSDLHLSEKNFHVLKCFLYILKRFKKIRSLYILGDFFDYWIGFDDKKLFFKKIKIEFKKLQNSGIKCYFIYGNRDFLIDKKIVKQMGFVFLSREKVLNIFGQNILILHGDALCTNDFWYQIYRKLVCNKFFKKLFFIFSLSIRKKIVKFIRKNSKFSNRKKSKIVLNINTNTVIKKFKKYKVSFMIHGHIHIPLIDKIKINKKNCFRIVLSDWNKQGSFVEVSSKKIQLIHFLLKN